MRQIASYEALVRGRQGQPAAWVFARVPGGELSDFDQRLRGHAIEAAAALGLRTRLNLNLVPHSLSASDDAIRATMATAERVGLSPDRLVIEVTERQMIESARFAAMVMACRSDGVRIAIDDFGSGYSGLNLLADFQPDIIKLDMHLVRGIASHRPRQTIVRGVAGVCATLGIEVIVEGVETTAEYEWFLDAGLSLFQGYYFARPALNALPDVTFPGSSATTS